MPTVQTGADIGRIFVDPAAFADPRAWHERATEIRRTQPLLRVEADGYPPFWAVTRHADVMQVARQNARFPNTDQPILFSYATMEGLKATGLDVKSLVHMDGALHAGYRSITNDSFKPASLRSLQTRLDALAKRSVDRLAAQDGIVDFVAEVATPFPLHTIMTILGIPEDDEPLMLELTQEIFGSTAPAPTADGDDAAAAAFIQTLLKFAQYFMGITADRRADPRDDLATVIAHGQIDGAPIGDLEMIGYYVTIATAGHDTTSACLAGGLEALLRDPAQIAVLGEGEAELVNAVEEMIRWTSPVRHFLRHTIEECEVSGVTLPPGEALLLSYPSANRDEAVFQDPHRFAVDRSNARDNLGFGWGVHHCLGSQLARMELRAFYREFAARLETAELAAEPEYSEANFIGGVKRLPLRCTFR